MSLARCPRCGRQRPASDRGSECAATGTDIPLYGPAEAPWASIDGEDVCPECQSAEERRDVAKRGVAAIEREIERRRSTGLPSDPYEAALIAYAMASRSAAEPAHGKGHVARHGDAEARLDEGHVPPDPHWAPKPTDGTDELRRCVAVTGAFLTGHPLTVRLDKYDEVQRALGRKLKGPQWRTEGLGEQGGTFESGGGFSEPVPLVIARREGADLVPHLSAALDDCREDDARWLDQRAPGMRATPRKLTIDIYDFGMAVLTAWFDVVGAPGTTPGATARAVRELVRLREDDPRRPPLAAELQRIAHDITKQYGEAVGAEVLSERQDPWLARSKAPWPPNDQGRLLWLHPIHVEWTSEPTKRAALDLAPAFRRSINLDGGVFAAGIGWSAVVASPGSRAADTPIRLTEVHWAYYALFMEIDRGLLGVLNQHHWSEPAPFKQLERDAEDVFVDYLRVMDARARLDSALDALGGDELAIWDIMAKVQRFDALLDAVERKLDVLQKLAQRRVEEATAARARLAGTALGYLSVLTLVGLAVALTGALLGSVPGSGSVWVRVAIVVVVWLVSIFLWWLIFVRTTRARSPYARHRRQS